MWMGLSPVLSQPLMRKSAATVDTVYRGSCEDGLPMWSHDYVALMRTGVPNPGTRL